MFEQQPMKMAAAEALCHTETDADFSILAIGTNNDCDGVTHLIEMPGRVAVPGRGQVQRVDAARASRTSRQRYEEQFGPGNYRPNLFVTYWSFRLMIGLAAGSVALAPGWLVGHAHAGGCDRTWFKWLCLIALPTPFLANSAGWIFTEMGRQPWVVAPESRPGVDGSG